MKKILITLVVLVLMSSFAMAKTPVLNQEDEGNSIPCEPEDGNKMVIGDGTGVYYESAGLLKASVNGDNWGNRIIDQMSFEGVILW